jgi:hypothetical protein
LATYWNQLLECDHFFIPYLIFKKSGDWKKTTKITFIFTFVIFNFANKPSTYNTFCMMTWGPRKTAQEPTANCNRFSMGITYISGFVPFQQTLLLPICPSSTNSLG